MDNVTTFHVKVTEEIKPKKVRTFIRTQIHLQNIFTSKGSYFFYSYIPELLQYEIIVFETLNKLQQYSFLFFQNLLKEINEYTLFIEEKFFCLYKKEKLIVFKEIENVKQIDIVSYIKQYYKIDELNTIELNDYNTKDLIESLTRKDLQKAKRGIYRVSEDKGYLYLLFYTFTIFITTIYFGYNYYLENGNTDRITQKTERVLLSPQQKMYENYKIEQAYQKIESVMKYLELYKIGYKTLKYSNKKIKSKVYALKKENLLQLLNFPHQKVKIEFIKYKKELNSYEAGVEFYD